MSAMARGPISVTEGTHYLAYSVPLSSGMVAAVAYVFATCGSLLLASDRLITWFGAVNLVAVLVLSVLLFSGVISLWCVWAAIASAAIALHLRRADPHGHRFQLTPTLR
ncbi:MAG: hypothetical protein QNL12_14480 [Acidimicrobiia bacterium]|nr:hypothetical protein [Acidimicrobiia bacterium]MDX2468522.1 hypothetical protein [Acidimicrobiia bacterium]